MFFKINKFSKKIYSQFGEDGIIDYIIKTSSIPICKTLIDIGAYDGKKNSNTYNLIKNSSFRGLLVDCNKVNFNKLKKLYSENEKVDCIEMEVEPVGNKSIDALIRSKFDPKSEIGYLSIDIQSSDYYLFKNLQSKPQIISIEFNPSIPPYIDYFDPPGEVYLKCSAKSIERLAIQKGYKLICCSPNNAFLIRNDCFNSKYHPNAPVEFLFDYEGLLKVNNGLYTIIHSNPYTTYPICTKPLNIVDSLYFKLTRRLFSFFKIRKEKYIKPNKKILKKIKKSKLYI